MGNRNMDYRFKCGDRVKVIRDVDPELQIGSAGTVTNVLRNVYIVRMDTPYGDRMNSTVRLYEDEIGYTSLADALAKQDNKLMATLLVLLTTTVAATLIAYCVAVVPAYASMSATPVHSTEIVGCSKNIHIREAKLVREGVVTDDTGYKWYAEGYDTNGDGRTDIVALSTLLVEPGDNIVHGEHPLYYMVDFNHDGELDAQYIDKSGTGDCNQIELLYDLREQEPTTPNKDEPERGRASK